jgi:hypothetical protein
VIDGVKIGCEVSYQVLICYRTLNQSDPISKVRKVVGRSSTEVIKHRAVIASGD